MLIITNYGNIIIWLQSSLMGISFIKCKYSIVMYTLHTTRTTWTSIYRYMSFCILNMDINTVVWPLVCIIIQDFDMLDVTFLNFYSVIKSNTVKFVSLDNVLEKFDSV